MNLIEKKIGWRGPSTTNKLRHWIRDAAPAHPANIPMQSGRSRHRPPIPRAILPYFRQRQPATSHASLSWKRNFFNDNDVPLRAASEELALVELVRDGQPKCAEGSRPGQAVETVEVGAAFGRFFPFGYARFETWHAQFYCGFVFVYGELWFVKILLLLIFRMFPLFIFL